MLLVFNVFSEQDTCEELLSAAADDEISDPPPCSLTPLSVLLLQAAIKGATPVPSSILINITGRKTGEMSE